MHQLMIYEDTETLYRFQPRIIAIGSFSVRIQIQFWRQACIVCDRLPLGALAQALMLHSRTSLLIFHRLIVSHFGTQVFLCRSTVSRHISLFALPAAYACCTMHNVPPPALVSWCIFVRAYWSGWLQTTTAARTVCLIESHSRFWVDVHYS